MSCLNVPNSDKLDTAGSESMCMDKAGKEIKCMDSIRLKQEWRCNILHRRLHDGLS